MSTGVDRETDVGAGLGGWDGTSGNNAGGNWGRKERERMLTFGSV